MLYYKTLSENDIVQENTLLSDSLAPTDLCRFVVDEYGVFVGILSVSDYLVGVAKNATAGDACNKTAYYVAGDDPVKTVKQAIEFFNGTEKIYYVPVLTNDLKPAFIYIKSDYSAVLRFPVDVYCLEKCHYTIIQHTSEQIISGIETETVRGHIESICDDNSLRMQVKGDRGYIELSKREPLHITGWIVNDFNRSSFDAVYICIDNSLYRAGSIERNDVAITLGDKGYSMCGYSAYFLSPDLEDGEHLLRVIGVTTDGKCFAAEYSLILNVKNVSIPTPASEYKSCNSIEKSIVFDVGNKVCFCCVPSGMHPIVSTIGEFDVDYFLAMRAKSKEYPLPGCRMCNRYVNGIWKSDGRLESIIFGDGGICNFKCEYCSIVNTGWENRPTSILLHLYELSRKNLITKGCSLSIAAGEPAFLPNIDDVLNWAEQVGCIVRIDTNCSVYKPSFERVLINGGTIKCSIDAGTGELFHKIKGVNCFDKVIDNISKYTLAGDVIAKYIIYESNYDEKEIYSFVILMRRIGIKTVIFDFDARMKLSYLYSNSEFLSSMAYGKYTAEKHGITVQYGMYLNRHPQLIDTVNCLNAKRVFIAEEK